MHQPYVYMLQGDLFSDGVATKPISTGAGCQVSGGGLASYQPAVDLNRPWHAIDRGMCQSAICWVQGGWRGACADARNAQG
jgi:hypothetical protein